jgi:hypothetical protein
MKNKYTLTAIVLVILIISFLGGFLYAQKDFDAVNRLAMITTVMRDDALLAHIEAGDISKAKKIQTEYLKFSLLSLSVAGGEWPENINSIIRKRKDIVSSQVVDK